MLHAHHLLRGGLFKEGVEHHVPGADDDDLGLAEAAQDEPGFVVQGEVVLVFIKHGPEYHIALGIEIRRQLEDAALLADFARHVFLGLTGLGNAFHEGRASQLQDLLGSVLQHADHPVSRRNVTVLGWLLKFCTRITASSPWFLSLPGTPVRMVLNETMPMLLALPGSSLPARW